MRIDEKGFHTLEEDIQAVWRSHGWQVMEERVRPLDKEGHILNQKRLKPVVTLASLFAQREQDNGVISAAVWIITAEQTTSKKGSPQIIEIQTIWKGHGWQVTSDKEKPCEKGVTVWTIRAEQIKPAKTKEAKEVTVPTGG